MSTEGTPSIDETNRQLDRAIWREMRKPLAAGAIAALSFLVGNHIDDTHQAQADELGTEFQSVYDTLPGSERAVVDVYLSGDDLPEGTSPELADEAHRLGEISEEQSQEEDAGELWTFAGQIATLYAGGKITVLGVGRMLSRDTIRRQHPDLAPARVRGRADRLVTEGGWIEEDDKLDEKYDWKKPSEHAIFFGNQLREVGQDIEAAESFSLSKEGVSRLLCDMLNHAQFETMINEIRDQDESNQLSELEALQIRVVNDLWKPTDTFKSVKDWYAYRRRQVINPGSYHQVYEGQLYLPEIVQTEGGIGVAVGRIAQYWRTYTELRYSDRSAASDAMVFATEGAGVLDELAFREDGSHWIDYVDSLVKGVKLERTS